MMLLSYFRSKVQMYTGCLLTRTLGSPRSFITLTNHNHVQSSRDPRRAAHDRDEFLSWADARTYFQFGTSTAEGMYVHVLLSDYVLRDISVAMELLHDSMVFIHQM
jgi:hypothetical protein